MQCKVLVVALHCLVELQFVAELQPCYALFKFRNYSIRACFGVLSDSCVVS